MFGGGSTQGRGAIYWSFCQAWNGMCSKHILAQWKTRSWKKESIFPINVFLWENFCQQLVVFLKLIIQGWGCPEICFRFCANRTNISWRPQGHFVCRPNAICEAQQILQKWMHSDLRTQDSYGLTEHHRESDSVCRLLYLRCRIGWIIWQNMAVTPPSKGNSKVWFPAKFWAQNFCWCSSPISNDCFVSFKPRAQCLSLLLFSSLSE